jgi:uncharacterized DUF497 family protein
MRLRPNRTFRKHGIDFAVARRAFEDPRALDRYDESSGDYGEDRFVLIGMAAGQLVFIVYTGRQGVWRLISARKASKEEHDDYYRQGSQE